MVFVAVYQKALKLLYVDALLKEVKQVRQEGTPPCLLSLMFNAVFSVNSPYGCISWE